MANIARPEQIIQRAVIQHLRQRGVPGVVFLHVPNGGYRRPIEAAIFKAMGVRAGTADLLLWNGGKSYCLELKAKGGRATEDQRQFLADMEKAGAFTCLAEGLNPALAVLEKWGLLRGVAT
jgi:VRR-NUC domain